MRAEARLPEIFRLGDGFRRKVVGRILHDEHFSGTKSGDKPLKAQRKLAQGRSLDPSTAVEETTTSELSS